MYSTMLLALLNGTIVDITRKITHVVYAHKPILKV